MNYGESIIEGFKAYLINTDSMTSLSKEEKATGYGFLTLALTGLCSGFLAAIAVMFIGSSLGSPGLAGLISIGAILMSVVVTIIGFFIFYSIFHVLAKLFGGKATGAEFFRVFACMGFVSVVANILGLIPQAGGIINVLFFIWAIVVMVVALKTVHQLETWKAVVVVFLPVVVILFLALSLGLMAGSMMSMI